MLYYADFWKLCFSKMLMLILLENAKNNADLFGLNLLFSEHAFNFMFKEVHDRIAILYTN